MTLRINFGRRQFSPSWLMTLLTLILLVAFVGLGRWQYGRAEVKQRLWDEFAQGADAAIGVDGRTLDALPRYQHLRLVGRWQTARQFLLDNRIVDGAAGFEALTPFQLLDGRVVLVNRGWQKFNGRREQLPAVDFEPGADVLTLRGRIDELPSAGIASGRAAPLASGGWPRLTTFPRSEELAAALGVSIEKRILLLDAAEPQGYVRRWKPPGVSPDTHWSYAIQWWAFAVVLLILYVTLNLRRVPQDLTRT